MNPPVTARIPLVDYRPQPAVRLSENIPQRPAAPVIEAHNHLGRWLTPWVREGGGWMVEDVGALVAMLDQLNIAAVVNLDGGWEDELEANLDRYDRARPERFVTFCHVDWSRLAEPGGPDALVRSLERSRAQGARGLKVWKNLGLGIRDASGAFVLPNDPRAAPVFARAGELGLPVIIHVADPVAFFSPLDARNERLEELGEHPEWSFHGPEFPRFERIMESFEAVVSAHPGTRFVGAHVGCNAEDLGWVDRMLTSYPNLSIDISARISELGRQPRAARRLLVRHADRVLFGTDEFPPAVDQYRTYFRFLETADEHFAYSPDPDRPWPRGRWRISGLELDHDVLERIYATNARELLGLG